MIRFGLLIALLVILCDQASKVLVLNHFTEGEVLRLTSFFNLVLVWNRGVSFGMLGGGGTSIPWLLSGLALAVVIALVFWLRTVEHHLIAVGLGLVIGGALGNVIDRIRFGAVVDFLDFHAFGYHWPAFNIADSAICVGAAVLLVDGLLAPRRRTT